jgi:hypothetical protein
VCLGGLVLRVVSPEVSRSSFCYTLYLVGKYTTDCVARSGQSYILSYIYLLIGGTKGATTLILEGKDFRPSNLFKMLSITVG